ncbi:uncharacterized protein CCOS01_11123 [Colletotrichum costaricense]|uniref:Uncharacterized protein n=1 Tax=Colletotrichum costaricense TaxID=1209916 RepID=A0AAI9YQG2_9PEZI|nr:uncharacterized protein CCOS01_11123 [Colletotrichum costaricense]KAK1519472.1 hypothetical protein CCOS01_11123 [Colletotrichum costaricense]
MSTTSDAKPPGNMLDQNPTAKTFAAFNVEPRNLIMGKSTYPPHIIVSLTICIDAGPKERMFKAEDESSPR